jgi:DNA-nicking Smr family endonuclease
MNDRDGKPDKPDSARLFREAVSDAAPLTAKKRHQPDRPKPKPKARQRAADERAALRESLQTPADIADVETGEELLFKRDHISVRTFRRLRRGAPPARASLDLHGYRETDAKHELQEFISYSVANGYRCVRVVHGKGLGSGNRGPIIKQGVNRWLRHWSVVDAFCSTPPHDGGTGAIYVLLRQRGSS